MKKTTLYVGAHRYSEALHMVGDLDYDVGSNPDNNSFTMDEANADDFIEAMRGAYIEAVEDPAELDPYEGNN